MGKTLSSNVSTATQVLARRRGDCTEHSLLFVALARALGLPARRVSGLVYLGDEVHRFGWHEWAEVVLDGKWVEVDPSWNQTAADATHLKVGVGPHDDAVMLMGRIGIKVVEVRP